MKLAVFAAERQETPAGKKNFENFTPLTIALNYITSLTFANYVLPAKGAKNSVIYFFAGQYYLENKNLSLAALCDP